MKKIIVTGATGYLGGHLVNLLIKKNYKVLCIVTDKNILRGLNSHLSKIHLLETSHISFSEQIYNFSPDVIIHCAAVYDRNGASLTNLVDANYYFPSRILEAVATIGKEVHWINTDTSLPRNINLYSLTKHQFANLGRYYSKNSSLVFSNILLEQFYGEKDSENKFVPFLLNKMKKDESINLTDGLQKRDFIYINDILSAYIILIEHTAEKGYYEYPLGTGTAPMIKDIVIYLKEITKSKSKLNFGAIDRRENEPDCLVADITQLKKLGLSIQYDWRTGLKKLVEESI